MTIFAGLFCSLANPADVRVSTIEESESSVEVFRSVGEDGVVEFNDYGVGEKVTIDVPEALSEAEISIVRERQQDILEVARTLSSDRFDREAERFEERERRREAQSRLDQELAALRAADEVYYPARVPGFAPFYWPGRVGFGRRRPPPRYVYAPGPDHPSNGLRHPGYNPPPPVPAPPRRSIETVSPRR